jgi:hypothetical protein
MPTADLWPDFAIEPKPRGIRQMLEEAGRGLKEKTNGLIAFRVQLSESQARPARPFLYRCELYVENLDYAFPLLYVNVGMDGGFPVEVVTTNPADPKKAWDEAGLNSILATVFQSEETKAIVRNLISMATE